MMKRGASGQPEREEAPEFLVLYTEIEGESNPRDSAGPAGSGRIMPEETARDMSGAEREKRSAAFASITAAVLLTVLKLAVGLATNSLGVLSEAAHSALDLLAAAMTYLAVRMAAFPPDTDHPYGHGKVENLSALVEALLLVVTCFWITGEAVDRLFFNPVPVTPSVWAVLVMAVSIVVDYSRSRMLMRVAKEHRSQALEADALHFSTDMLSSSVVIVGLAALSLAHALPEDSFWRPLLERADALAALGVSAIVLRVSWSLGKRAVNVLLDASDAALEGKIRAALRRLSGIREVRALKPRHSGPDLFVDLVLGVDTGLTLDEGEHIRREVENAVRGVEPHAEVSVVLAPAEADAADRITRLRGLAAAHGLVSHAVEVLDLKSRDHDHVLVEMHVEFPGSMPLREAHEKVSAFEKHFRETRPDVIMVTHIEPQGEEGAERVASPVDSAQIKEAVFRAVAGEPGVRDPHGVLTRSFGEGRRVSFHCRMDPDVTVEEAHRAATRLQKRLHEALPDVMRVTVHMEPFREDKASGPEAGLL